MDLRKVSIFNAKIWERKMSIFTKNKSDGEQKKSKVSQVLLLILVGGVAYYLIGGGVEEGVANDVVEQYNLVKESGDKMQMCVRAGLVAEVYLQAGNKSEYRNWTDIKNNDCAEAGVPQ